MSEPVAITLARTADRQQRRAYDAFVTLVEADPELAGRAFDAYQASDRPVTEEAPARRLTASERTALGTIATFFTAEADQYTRFGDPSIEEENEHAREVWRALSQATREKPEAETAAKTKWRRGRIASYIAHSRMANERRQSAQPMQAVEPSVQQAA